MCDNSVFFVSKENNGDDKRRIYFSIQYKPKFRRKIQATKNSNSQTPFGHTLHTSLIGHFCGHNFQSCSKQRNKQVMFYSSLPFPLSMKKTFSYDHHSFHWWYSRMVILRADDTRIFYLGFCYSLQPKLFTMPFHLQNGLELG